MAEDILLEKSRTNKIALIHLMDKGLFAPAIHCGYYSCMQKLMFILEYYYEISADDVAKALKWSKGGIHGHYIKEIAAKLQDDNHRDGRDFKSKMTQLRDLRIKSDYGKVHIDKNMAIIAEDYVNNIHRIVDKYMPTS